MATGQARLVPGPMPEGLPPVGAVGMYRIFRDSRPEPAMVLGPGALPGRLSLYLGHLGEDDNPSTVYMVDASPLSFWELATAPNTKGRAS